MRVIGIDPGTRHLGWGLVQREGTRLVHIAHGVVDTDTTAPLAERLCQIERELVDAIAAHRPDAGAVEAIFFSKDPQAAAKLGHARGVALLVLARAGLTVGEYPPTLVKQAVVGTGRADKHQVAMIVKTMLRLPELARTDASDALAVAICHLNVAGFRARLGAAR